MVNGLPDPKAILQQQVASVKGIEGTLPKGFPAVSNVLTSVANTLPDMPTMPGAAGLQLPMGLQLPTGMRLPTGVQLPAMPAVTNFVRSVETALPTGLPQVSGVLGNQGGYRREAPTRAAGARAGGYRPIT